MVKLYNKFINLESLSKEIIQFQFQNIQQNLDLKGEYNDPIGQECYWQYDLVFKMLLVTFPFYYKIFR